MKLNLGCGKKKLEGYVNCDLSKEVSPDVVLDLEKPLPFKTNSVDEIVGNHILEHISRFIPLLHELHRICKNKSLLNFKVPFYLSVGAFNDPTHVRFFTPFTFKEILSDEFGYEFGTTGMFKEKRVKISYGIGFAKKINWFMDPLINLNHRLYCKIMAGVLPAAEIEFGLEVIKNS